MDKSTRRGSASKQHRVSRASFVDDGQQQLAASPTKNPVGNSFPSFVLDSKHGGLATPFDVADAPPTTTALMSRKGSVVFPSLAMAERSAALRKSKSGVAQLVLQRRRSAGGGGGGGGGGTNDSFGDFVEGGGGGGESPSTGSFSAPTLHRRKSTRLESAASMLLLRHGSTASIGSNGSIVGGGSKRRLVSFRTAVMAVMMLIRIHAAVERRRRALKLREQMVTPRESISASSSLPNTARRPAASAGTPSMSAPTQLRTTRADAYGATPFSHSTAIAAPPIGSMTAPAAVLSNMSFAGSLLTGGDESSVAANDKPSSDQSSSSSDDDDPLEDQLSVASWNSNDHISDASEEDEADAVGGRGRGVVRTTFFPHPRDIAQLPAEMRVHLERRALKSLRRFISVYRFRRYITARKARRTKPTIATLPPGVLEGSEIFRGWSPAMVEAVLASGFSQTWYGGSFIAYPREPQRFVYIVTEGSACEVRRRSNATTTTNTAALRSSSSTTPADAALRTGAAAPTQFSHKRLSPSTANSEILKSYQTPVVLKANAALVQHVGGADVGIFAVTSCTVIVLLVSEVEHVFRSDTTSLSESARAAVCERYKTIRQERSHVFLRGRVASLEKEVQADTIAAKAAAAAKVLGTSSSITATGDGGEGVGATEQHHGTTTTDANSGPEPSRQASAAKEILSLNIRSSKLLEHLNKDQERLVVARLAPQSFFAGEVILDKGQDDFKNIYFVLRGTIVAVSKYRDDSHDDRLSASQRRLSRRRSGRGTSMSASLGLGGGGTAGDGGSGGGVWKDMVFSRWSAGESVGDKALYFQEPHVFTLRAETNCDLVVLKRTVLISLMDSAERSGLKQCVASGAFAVRANDPVVRLRLSSVRSIPCVEAAIDEGLIQDATVRELHALFKIHVFPAGELITSSSDTVKRIVVTSTGTAVVDVNSAMPFTLINGTPIGCTVLANMRWRYAVYAETECEGWVLPVEEFVAFCRARGMLKRMTELSVEQYQILQRTDGSDDMLFEVPTPQDVVIVALAQSGNAAARSALKAKLILPTHRILEQRSFQQKLPADVPVPPLPAPLPAAMFLGPIAGSSHHNHARMSIASSSLPHHQKPTTSPQSAGVAPPARRDSVNSNQSADGATATLVDTPGKQQQPPLLSARKSEFLTLTPAAASLALAAVTPRQSLAADPHQSPKTPSHQKHLTFTSPTRGDDARTPRPNHFAQADAHPLSGDAGAELHNPSMMRLTPRPSLPKPLTLPMDEYHHQGSDTGGGASTSTPLLSATGGGPNRSPVTSPTSPSKLSSSMSRRRQLLYRFMEDFVDRSYYSAAGSPVLSRGDDSGSFLESPLVVVDPLAASDSLEGQQHVDWHSPQRHQPRSTAASPTATHHQTIGGLEVTSPVALMHRRAQSSAASVRSVTSAASQRHRMLKSFSSSSFYQMRQVERLAELQSKRPGTSGRDLSPYQRQQQQHAPPSNSSNAGLVGTKRWCVTPPPHASYGQSLKLSALSCHGSDSVVTRATTAGSGTHRSVTGLTSPYMQQAQHRLAPNTR